jgi:hypothetical protein
MCALVGIGGAAAVFGVVSLIAGKKDEKIEAVRYFGDLEIPHELQRRFYGDGLDPVSAIYDTDAKTLKVRVEACLSGFLPT